MENIVIRDYRSEDYLPIIDLWLKTGYGRTSRYENQKMIEKSIKMGGKLLVANTSEGILAGTSWLTFDGHCIHLHHLSVLPALIAKGIGRCLIGEAVRFSREKGYQIKMEASNTNKALIKQCSEMGFNFIGEFFVFIFRD